MDEIVLKRTGSADPDFQMLIHELDIDLRLRNGDIMDFYDEHNIIAKIDTVVIAYLNGTPAGCACFKHYEADTVELKRMFVRPEARGKGISSLILAELEAFAKSLGFMSAVLETGSKQVEALVLYPKKGYVLIPNYGSYIGLPDSICFRKQL